VSRHCSICGHSRKDDINVALAAGLSNRDASERFVLTKSAIFRHRQDHLPVGLVEAEKKRQLREAEEFLVALEELHALTAGALKTAKEAGDLTAIARLVVASKGIIETSARLTGELRDTSPTQVAVVLKWGEGVEAAPFAPRALRPGDRSRDADRGGGGH
jgi:hypothetical protein